MDKSISHDAYNELADSYNAQIATKPHNAYYDRPAVISLIPEVLGKNILDAGCGPGVYAEWLIRHGAQVTGIDANERMLNHAKHRLGDKATLFLANLEEPLSFLPDNTFDGILSPLTISYILDHEKLFKEFNRILCHHGWFIFSTEHPFYSYQLYQITNYFETKRVESIWDSFSKKVTMPGYYHSLGSLSDALTNNGFLIEKILEPRPTEEFKLNDEKHYHELMNFPGFICFKARKI